LRAVSLPWGLAWRLAAGQIVAWGILYYAFTVIVGPMHAGTGWSRTFLNAGLSVGLVVWGICALPAGAWIQRRGGRGLMTVSSFVGGGALVLMGTVPHPLAYFCAWIFLGAAMAGMLYDSAFAVVTAAFGEQYRRGITLVTLVGGLASTVFIPLAQLAVDRLGWNGALVALGFTQIAVGVPLHFLGIPTFPLGPQLKAAGESVSAHRRLGAWWTKIRGDIADPRFLGLALWFTGHAAAFTGLIFQLVPILQTLRVDNRTILMAIAIIGPMQVLGRVVLATRGSDFSTLQVGQWTMVGLAAAMLILLLLPPQLLWLGLFAAIYGASNGVTTILRGTAIAELFGRERYAELNGALSAPAVLAKAAAPLALAGLWSISGEPKVVFGGVLALVLTGFIGLLIASRARQGGARNIGLSTVLSPP
jgi:MFS family permease